jgi:2-oxoisovalerate dehydrogenase E2 component (dihydrolipoyl transacylase)
VGEYVIKLPDVGEGVAEAELVEWLVKEGANVREDEVLAAVMTDKATVEIPSPVEGKVIWLGGKPGDVLAVGSPLIRLSVDGAGNAAAAEPRPAKSEASGKPAANGAAAAKPTLPGTDKRAVIPAKPAVASATAGAEPGHREAEAPKPHRVPDGRFAASLTTSRAVATIGGAPRPEGEKPLAAPAVRKRAADAGVDLRRVRGSGPAGRISHEDLDAFLKGGAGVAARGARPPDTGVTEIPVIGLRRKIAEKMKTAKSRIPHITYVDEVDVTALEELRTKLNADNKGGKPKLTILPFLMRAVARALAEQPKLNALFDDEAGVIRQHGGVHIGIAAQTDNGLVVPVVRHVEARGLYDCAAEASRLAEAAKAGTATRDELGGSTITITSLGALGGIVTTPVINHPEVAIIGVNKIQILPRWDGTQFLPRKAMNLSSSFDHRVIDGWDAAVFIQKIKGLLENPAAIFIEDT